MNSTATNSLSGGAIVGIVVGAVVFLLLVGVAVYFVCVKSTKKVHVGQKVFTIPAVGTNRLKRQ